MEIIRGLHNLRTQHQGCVATIGNFDGVHCGHKQILKRLVDKSGSYQLDSLVITFEPQPQEFFSHKAPARLTRFRDKAEVISNCGIDRLLAIQFNRSFSQMTAEHFVEKLLVEKLGVRYLQIGDDFQFGKNRSGNFDTLIAGGKKFAFEVEKTDTCYYQGERVSSTRIRNALEAGNMEVTTRLLGRPYWMSGHIQHGDKRGRTIGFPTANIPLHRQTPAVSGVFAVRLWGEALSACKNALDARDRHGIDGIANIGYRPTVDGTKGLLEVHLFDFDSDLYGKLVHVDFLHKIRDEKKFASFDYLKQQILQDVKEAKSYFASL